MSSGIGLGEFIVVPVIGFVSNHWASELGSVSVFGWRSITRPINVAAKGDKTTLA
jgi:hypothetical protein